MKRTHLMTAVIFAAGLAAPALSQAQILSPVTGYGTLGATATQENGADLGTLQGRLGARFGQHVGVEGELSTGIDGDKTSARGTGVKTSLRNQKAVYGVGFLPVTSKIELMARVGYGNSVVRTRTGTETSVADRDSVNYGVGAQYALSDKNGIRADYTRHDYRHDGGDADSYGLSYVRKF